MKKNISVAVAMLAAGVAIASDSGELLVQRGDARIDIGDLDARMSRIPESDRALHAQRPDNLARTMDQLVLNRQLANEARELKLDQDATIRRDLELAQEEVLAVHRLNALMTSAEEPDYEQIAHERYLVDRTEFTVPEQRVVEHILIGTDDRSEDEALESARAVRRRVLEDGADFATLVAEHSDDPGKTQNQGRYTVSRPGEFVPEFEQTARSLAEPGDVSEPTKTRFGYHIIRLVEIVPESRKSFDEVKLGLIEKARADFLKNVRESHIRELKALPEQGNEELLITLPERYMVKPESSAP